MHRVAPRARCVHVDPLGNGSRNTLGDYQRSLPIDPSHELLQRPGVSGLLEFFPAHPHEGSVAVPADDPSARVVAWGTSRTAGRRINLVIAFEHSVDASGKRLGRGIAESSFHHFADYHWDTSRGAPSFVTEPEGDGMKAEPRAQEDISRYVRNIASWRAPVTCRCGGLGTHVSIEALPTSCTRAGRVFLSEVSSHPDRLPRSSDLFVTRTAILEERMAQGVANSIPIKLNQIGTR